MHVCREKNSPSEMLSIIFRFDVFSTDVIQLIGNEVFFPGAVNDFII